MPRVNFYESFFALGLLDPLSKKTKNQYRGYFRLTQRSTVYGAKQGVGFLNGLINPFDAGGSACVTTWSVSYGYVN